MMNLPIRLLLLFRTRSAWLLHRANATPPAHGLIRSVERGRILRRP